MIQRYSHFMSTPYVHLHASTQKNFLYPTFQSCLLQAPDQSTKPFATAHESMYSLTFDHFSFQWMTKCTAQRSAHRQSFPTPFFQNCPRMGVGTIVVNLHLHQYTSLPIHEPSSGFPTFTS